MSGRSWLGVPSSCSSGSADQNVHLKDGSWTFDFQSLSLLHPLGVLVLIFPSLASILNRKAFQGPG